MKKHRNKIIIGIIISAVLAFAFWWGGDAPSLRGWDVKPTQTTEITAEEENELTEKIEKSVETQTPKKTDVPQKQPSPDTKSEQNDKPVPSKEAPTEYQEKKITDESFTCTLSVRCDTILRNFSRLNENKKEFVPSDGIIFAEKEVVFYEGESVFNLLVREMKNNKIHLEFVNTPMYGSAYIEGIANLYEFDCGALSGWTYMVNGVFPNYGCSLYKLKQGDKVEWVYTCDLGNDVGGYNVSVQKDE